MPLSAIREFLRHEAAGGVVLLAAAALAFILTNSPLADHYLRFFELHLSLKLGDLGLDKSLGHWINDGLMAIFFFLVGLEIKRELIEGELSSAAPGGAAGDRRDRRHGGAGPGLCPVQRRARRRTLTRLGDPDRHRHRLRRWAWSACSATACPESAEDLSAGARDHRRSRRHRRHRDLLYRRSVAAGARPGLDRHRGPRSS